MSFVMVDMVELVGLKGLSCGVEMWLRIGFVKTEKTI